ncbi:MAG: hypothetical protein IIA87_00535 [Nanoarchaeota archaeon]|nr:hypothetical protein [Nanoarchaeota archaeon]
MESENPLNLKEDDVVLCTVKRVEGTTVFLEIEENGQGNMIFSEVSPGRIRNIRDFVVPNKKIVCKVLRIKPGNIELSLRRVTAKERKEVLERYKKEKILTNMIKPILKEKTPDILEKIKEKYELADFVEEVRESPKTIEIIKKFVPKSKLEELKKIFFSVKHYKEKEVKEIIKLKTNSESGLDDIKKILKTDKAEIRYLGSSKFSILVKAKDYKIANSIMEKVLEEIKEKAKKLKVQLEVK